MSTINFRSVGTTRQNRVESALSSSLVPIGIKTPLRLGEDGNIFAMHTSLSDQINDNLRNLIMTNWGERLTLYDFGANLRSMLSEMVSQDDFDAQAVVNIKGAVEKWMPYVTLETFDSRVDRTTNSNSNGLAAVRIMITYNVPSLKVYHRNLEILLYAM